jgi:hypothetical protein
MSSNNVIQLDGILSQVQFEPIQTYSSNTTIQLSDQFDEAIDSSASFGQLSLNYIVFSESVDPTVQFGVENFTLNMQINGVSSIESTVTFDTAQVNVKIFADETASTEAFGVGTLNFKIFADSIDATTTFGWDEPLLDMQVAGVQSVVSTVEFGLPKINTTIYANSTVAENFFGTSKLNQKILADSTVNENAFGTPKVSSTIFAQPIASTLAFGWDEPLLNMQIVITDEIESEAVVAVPNVKKVIGPLSINTTVNFGLPTFTDNIHRLLIFKQDNLTKVGDTDAVVVAGGIRINPSLTKSTEAFAGNATLPSNPVGFISVNIDGNDYRIPYYN